MKKKRFVQIVEIISRAPGSTEGLDYMLEGYMSNFRRNVPKCRRMQIIFIENDDGKAKVRLMR